MFAGRFPAEQAAAIRTVAAVHRFVRIGVAIGIVTAGSASRQNSAIGAMWSALASAAGMKSNPRIRALVIGWREIPMSVALPLNRM